MIDDNLTDTASRIDNRLPTSSLHGEREVWR